jgi:putative endonuclease
MPYKRWLERFHRFQPLGVRGERVVAGHVRRELGMKLVARNVRCPGGELDLVALDGSDMVFIEVRTRRDESAGPPEMTLGAQKRKFLIRSARWFIASRRLEHWNPRFDVAAVIWPPGGKPVVRYHRNAFSA